MLSRLLYKAASSKNYSLFSRPHYSSAISTIPCIKDFVNGKRRIAKIPLRVADKIPEMWKLENKMTCTKWGCDIFSSSEMGQI